MSDKSDDILELILSYEELDPDERTRADAVLAEYPEYGQILTRLREAEGASGPEGRLPPIEPSPDLTLTPTERAEAERSLSELRSRLAAVALEAEPQGEEPPAHSVDLMAWFRRPWVARLVPLAAAVAIIVVVLRLSPGGVGTVASFDIQPAAGVRGSDPGATQAGWHTGDAFTLSIRATESFYAVVINVDGSGFPSLISPDTPSTRPRYLASGRVLQLPAPGSGEEWTLAGDPGSETFILVASPGSDPDLSHVLDQLVRLSAEVRDRGTLVEAMIAVLEQSIGPTRRVDIDHLP